MPIIGTMAGMNYVLSQRRMLQLLAGLILYGFTMALMIRAGLGLDPWDVFHQGVSESLGLSFGTVVFLTGILVLLAWIPLRQKPGIGTILNIVVIAVAVDVFLAVIPTPETRDIEIKTVMMFAGILGNGFAAALYVGADLGTGPRDGLWVGICARTGWSVRSVRTGIEVTVMFTGIALGGLANMGTVFYALLIGPVSQYWLPRVAVPETAPRPSFGWLRAPIAQPSRAVPPT